MIILGDSGYFRRWGWGASLGSMVGSPPPTNPHPTHVPLLNVFGAGLARVRDHSKRY